MLAFFGVTIFLSAALLFMVQPMAARWVLPQLGGTPAVWTTCMLLFQALLLAGYAYSHLLVARLKPVSQVVVHSCVLIAATVLTLPPGLRASLPPAPPAGSSMLDEWRLGGWVLLALFTGVGAPFFAVSTTGPLLQGWFSRTGHRHARDPYFLYAASNAGSLIGLLAYPLVVEPSMALKDQSRWWGAGFTLFAAMAIVCGVRALRVARGSAAVADAGAGTGVGVGADGAGRAAASDAPIGRARRVRWLFWSFVPSSLLLGVTQHISTDIAAAPMLWVLPLSLYLLTFIVAFSAKVKVSTAMLGNAGAVLATVVAALIAVRPSGMVLLVLAAHLAAFFVLALLCHRRLADDRPPASRLTEFYLMLAVGGVLGGIFNALVAPAIFNDVSEYGLALVLACLVRPAPEGARASSSWWKGLVAPAVVGACIAAAMIVQVNIVRGDAQKASSTAAATEWLRVYVPLAAALVLIRSRISVAGVLAIVLAVNSFFPEVASERILTQRRSFFGVHRVKESLKGGWRILVHGTTTHGMQAFSPSATDPSKMEPNRAPATYYFVTGPLGQFFVQYQNDARTARVGAIGLGVGSLAAYSRPGNRFTFYEIDPVVRDIASDPGLFGYISGARGTVDIVIGDGRRMIAAAPDGEFGLIVLDAFSSDAIPIHLMTVDAFRTYVAKLQPNGVLMAHITNRYFDLKPVIARIAKELGLTAMVCQDFATAKEAEQGKLNSTWVALARSSQDFILLAGDVQGRWVYLTAEKGDPLWTDDHASLLSVLK